MNWADVSNNQCFSCNTLQNAVTNGYFILKNAIPASNKMVISAEAESYVYIVPISGKTFNQLVVKSNLIAATLLPYSYTIYYDYSDGPNNIVGFSTSGEACSATFNSLTVYSNSSTVSVGAALYYDEYGTVNIYAVAYNHPPQIYYKINNNYITFQAPGLQSTGNVIHSVDSCSVCEQYEIQNFTESAIGIDYYNCSGIQIFDSIGSGNNLVFCSDTSYGPINSGGGSLYLLGICP